MAGVIDSKDVYRFKEEVHRSTEGKSSVHTTEQVNEELMKKKSVYVVTFQDDGSLRDKIKKICNSFSKQRYDLPEVTELAPQIMTMKSGITANIKLW